MARVCVILPLFTICLKYQEKVETPFFGRKKWQNFGRKKWQKTATKKSTLRGVDFYFIANVLLVIFACRQLEHPNARFPA